MLQRIAIEWKLSTLFAGLLLLSLVLSGCLPDPLVGPRLLPIITIVVLSSALIWVVVHVSLKRPVTALVKAMDRLAEKDFDFRLDEDEEGEFGALAMTFNEMADMLSASLTELQKNQDYLRRVLESSADIIITVNSTGRIQTMNSGAENVLGHNRMEVVGESIDVLLANPEVRKIAAKKLRHAENVVNWELPFITKAGVVRDVLVTLSRLRNSQGAIIGTIVMGKDITEEKRLQKELIQSQRFAAIGEVFTGIQHSMKNMLNALKGGSYMVRTGIKSDNRTMLSDGWEIVQEGITRLTEMSMDMLKYVKEWKPKDDLVDLSQILCDIERVIKQTAKDKGIDFQLIACPDIPQVSCDGKMVHSAVMDIASNAVDACVWKDYPSDEQPFVTMKLQGCDRNEVTIEIQDNGCGMTEEVKANIFRPFYSTKSKAGTGLGLSIASRMIEVHEGRIEVESEPDRGTLFRIVLPVERNDRHKEQSNG